MSGPLVVSETLEDTRTIIARIIVSRRGDVALTRSSLNSSITGRIDGGLAIAAPSVPLSGVSAKLGHQARVGYA